jgi:hypothetical protein
MLFFLELRNGQGVDPIVLGMRSDEFDERDAPREIEGNDHPKIAACDFESRTPAIQNFCIRSGKPHILHRIPFGILDQCSPTLQRNLRFRMSLGIGRKYVPRDNPHAEQYVPKSGTLQYLM